MNAVDRLARHAAADARPRTCRHRRASGRSALTWTASTDDVGVARYNVHRSATPAFTPTVANRVAQVTTGTSLRRSGLRRHVVLPRGGRGRRRATRRPRSNEASATSTSDTTAPTVSMTAPAGGSTLVGSVNVTANAADNVGVAGVQFRLDGTNLGAEDTSAPYSRAWDTRTVANDNAHADRDRPRRRRQHHDRHLGRGHRQQPAGGHERPRRRVRLRGAERHRRRPTRRSQANAGTLTGATRTTAGRYGGALSFSGAGDWVTTPDANSLDLSTAMTLEAWVNPSATGGWRTAVIKEGTGGAVLRPLRQQLDQPAERARAHRIQRARHARHGTAAAEHVVTPRGDLRRREPAAVRQRHAGRDAARPRARSRSAAARCGSAATRSPPTSSSPA